jgi:hypothetical protein
MFKSTVSMMKLVVLLFSTFALFASFAPAQAATTTPRPSLHIDPVTWPIYLENPAPVGDGPKYPTTIVTATVSNCLQGEYYQDATFKQDGVSLGSPYVGMEGNIVYCDAECTSTVALRASFYSKNLHPGKAIAHI